MNSGQCVFEHLTVWIYPLLQLWGRRNYRGPAATFPEIDLSGQDSLFAFIVLKLNYSLSDSSLQCVIKHQENCQYHSASKSLNALILHIPCSWGHFLSVFSAEFVLATRSLVAFTVSEMRSLTRGLQLTNESVGSKPWLVHSKADANPRVELPQNSSNLP